jgi:hypothetical protein
VNSTGESACVYPPQPLESCSKLGSLAKNYRTKKGVARHKTDFV